jgi:hypothetical protein
MRSRKVRREADERGGVLSEIGEEVLSRLRGDLRGIFDSWDEALDLLECVRGGPSRACGLGVVRLRGLKLCPMIVSLVLTLEFHRGLPSEGPETEGRGKRFPVGVAEPCLDAGEGEALLDGPL